MSLHHGNRETGTLVRLPAPGPDTIFCVTRHHRSIQSARAMFDDLLMRSPDVIPAIATWDELLDYFAAARPIGWDACGAPRVYGRGARRPIGAVCTREVTTSGRIWRSNGARRLYVPEKSAPASADPRREPDGSRTRDSRTRIARRNGRCSSGRSGPRRVGRRVRDCAPPGSAAH